MKDDFVTLGNVKVTAEVATFEFNLLDLKELLNVLEASSNEWPEFMTGKVKATITVMENFDDNQHLKIFNDLNVKPYNL